MDKILGVLAIIVGLLFWYWVYWLVTDQLLENHGLRIGEF